MAYAGRSTPNKELVLQHNKLETTLGRVFMVNRSHGTSFRLIHISLFLHLVLQNHVLRRHHGQEPARCRRPHEVAANSQQAVLEQQVVAVTPVVESRLQLAGIGPSDFGTFAGGTSIENALPVERQQLPPLQLQLIALVGDSASTAERRLLQQ